MQGNENRKETKQIAQLIVESESPQKKERIESKQKAAELFNTNRTYISEDVFFCRPISNMLKLAL